jgi:predicted metal-dependent peptidase
MLTQEQRVKKAHIALMKSKHTVWWGGVMMMGTSEVSDKEGLTAYTDGINKVYGRAFLTGVCKEDAEVAGLVLHENLHIGLRQGILNRDLWVENAKLANVAADMVVNDIIMEIHKEDPNLVKLPAGGCYEERFHNMNMREVYRLLKEECKGGGSGYKPKKKGQPSKGSGGGEQQDKEEGDGDEYSFDEHDFEQDGCRASQGHQRAYR